MTIEPPPGPSGRAVSPVRCPHCGRFARVYGRIPARGRYRAIETFCCGQCDCVIDGGGVEFGSESSMPRTYDWTHGRWVVHPSG